MMILVHYTTQIEVFDDFDSNNCFINQTHYNDRFIEINKYYKKYFYSQENLFFIIQYFDTCTSNKKFVVGKLQNISEDEFLFKKVADELCKFIIDELSLEKNTYIPTMYYREFYLDSDEDFDYKTIDEISNKIKLKYFSWEELIEKNEILHDKLINILFEREKVLKVASTYNPQVSSIKITEKTLQAKYISALKSIGFISNSGINVKNTVLQGDIGEFLMHTMISEYLDKQYHDIYVFPKLAFKTSPVMAAHGSDGSFYSYERKEIYYCEAKFYSDLNEALYKAVKSIENHLNFDYDFLQNNIELFKEVSNNQRGEIIEITENTKEKMIVFLMCDDIYRAEDIFEVINSSKVLKKLLELNEVIIFILPLLNKDKFMISFKSKSEKILEKNNDR